MIYTGQNKYIDSRLQTRPFSSRSVERNHFQLRTALPPCKVVHPCRPYFDMHNTYMLPALDDHSAQANNVSVRANPHPAPAAARESKVALFRPHVAENSLIRPVPTICSPFCAEGAAISTLGRCSSFGPVKGLARGAGAFASGVTFSRCLHS